MTSNKNLDSRPILQLFVIALYLTPSNKNLDSRPIFVMTSNKNLDSRPVLQLFVIALCAVSQPLNRKIPKMVLHVSLRLKSSYLEN